MTPTQIELHNAHKARLQRIAAAAARLNPKTDSEFSAALNAVENPVEVEENKDKWVEYQIEKNKPLWFSIVSHIKVTRLGGPHIRDIQKATCEVFGISLRDLLSARRSNIFVLPRHVSMYLAKELTTLSFPRIARATGDRDHTVALYAVRKITDLLKVDDDLRSKVETVRALFSESRL
jgi:chromosomal replication initiation ATPase DnaA